MNQNLENLRANKLLEWLQESIDDCDHEAAKTAPRSFTRGWYIGHKDACDRARFKIRELFFGSSATKPPGEEGAKCLNA